MEPEQVTPLILNGRWLGVFTRRELRDIRAEAGRLLKTGKRGRPRNQETKQRAARAAAIDIDDNADADD